MRNVKRSMGAKLADFSGGDVVVKRPSSGRQKLQLGVGALRSFDNSCTTQSHKHLHEIVEL